MKTIQFELWPECNVGCKFCYLNKRIRKTEDADKKHEMDKAEAFLLAGDMQDYTNVAFIGGEFMQGQLNTPEIRDQFFRLLQLTKDLILAGKLEGAWLSAALTEESAVLYEVLDMFKDIVPVSKTGGFWIITSYDTIGRFHKPKSEEVWKQHMVNIKTKYPNIRCNTTIILTQHAIERYLKSELHFQDFMDTYNTQLFFKPPHLIKGLYKDKNEMERRVPGFFVKRKDFLKFLAKVSAEEECYVFDKICNIHFRADTLLRSGTDVPEYREKDTRYEIASETFLPCGHPFPYAGYIDSEACMLCDKTLLS